MKAVQGTIRVQSVYFGDAFVTLHSKSGTRVQVLVQGLRAMNRACDGDRVVVELLPREQWCVPMNRMFSGNDAADEDAVMAAGELKSSDEALRTDEPLVNVLEGDAAVTESAETLTAATKGSTTMLTGRVVSVMQRAWKPICASLDLGSSRASRSLCIPMNRRFPKIALNLSSSQLEEFGEHRLLVQIDAWPRTSRYPQGHVARSFGEIGDRDSETAVLLHEHDIPCAPWSKSVLACLPDERDDADPQDFKNRLDLRPYAICSIDPPGCTDIDDALHCRVLRPRKTPIPVDSDDLDMLGQQQFDDGALYEVGVHIADVAHYVKPGTALDEEARRRSTSVYLVDRRIDMLPERLSTKMCSLQEGRERLTFSCIWVMNDRGEILSTQFRRCVIKSAAAMSYAEGQERMDRPELPDDEAAAAATRCPLPSLESSRQPLVLQRGDDRIAAKSPLAAQLKPITDSELLQQPSVSPFPADHVVPWRQAQRDIETWKRIIADAPEDLNDAQRSLNEAQERLRIVVTDAARHEAQAEVNRLQQRVAELRDPQAKLRDAEQREARYRDGAAAYDRTLTMSCKLLRHLARQLKAQRMSAGALQLASSEVKYVLGKDKKPTGMSAYPLKEANSVVEEFMLLANTSVAERILSSFPLFALLRRHNAPAAAMFKPLLAAAQAAGFELDCSNSRTLAESLDRCQRPDLPQFFNRLLRMQATRCMTQAQYCCGTEGSDTASNTSSSSTAPVVESSSSPFYHYGLALATYTHFTSPSRYFSPSN